MQEHSVNPLQEEFQHQEEDMENGPPLDTTVDCGFSWTRFIVRSGGAGLGSHTNLATSFDDCFIGVTRVESESTKKSSFGSCFRQRQESLSEESHNSVGQEHQSDVGSQQNASAEPASDKPVSQGVELLDYGFNFWNQPLKSKRLLEQMCLPQSFH